MALHNILELASEAECTPEICYLSTTSVPHIQSWTDTTHTYLTVSSKEETV